MKYSNRWSRKKAHEKRLYDPVGFRKSEPRGKPSDESPS